MITNSILRGWIGLVTVLLAFSFVAPVHAGTAGSINLLNDAYATLVQANHDYKGHRVRAMKQIEAALNVLGEKISGQGRGHEPQSTSDAQLRAAQALLQQAGAGLTGKALKHVNEAASQISTALSIR
jgi:hypothetical protein